MSARVEQEAVSIARRLDPRQREILRALFDYEVLLTHQLRILFFSSLRRCQSALKEVADQGLIQRDLPAAVGAGRGSALWTLTEHGVRVVAVLMRKPRSHINWMPRMSFLGSNRHLAHTMGVNRFFISLVEASTMHPGHGVEKWVPAKQVQSRNNWVTHDGFGRYQHEGGACDFYFEYDRGTEWHDQLVRKLRGYLLMAMQWTEEGAQNFPNVLVLVPEQKRDAAFDKAIVAAVESLEIDEKEAVRLPFFIASEELIASEGILGRVWRAFVPAPQRRWLAPIFLSSRVSLIELPTRKTGPFDLDKCLGKKWTGGGARSRLRLLFPPTFPAGTPPDQGAA